ncbi:hypothetical protein [Rhodococcoides kyotonense]|uniref:Uncharacterized protein n=1 Tax=Rhodococcoides kyotonense TaxID=398843 RepID=A0A239E6M0_9NOCA|nr:hypothetical protein [Rhodococcus kyotonensis]SNS39928.1 hypothetical protein SAMN05421642_102215 [Rhodococcus kyotonensis]
MSGLGESIAAHYEKQHAQIEQDASEDQAAAKAAHPEPPTSFHDATSRMVEKMHRIANRKRDNNNG